MIVVTGASGKAGRACVKDLIANGREVLCTDLVPPADETVPFTRADLTDYGQTIAVLSAVDDRLSGPVEGIIHLAAIRAPGLAANHVTFAANTISTYNVFEAARVLGIRNVVWASSETVLGLPFDTPPPYVPVDEDYPGRPETAYSLSKLMGETMAEQFCRWDPALKIVGLRLSNVMDPQDYAGFPGFDADAGARKWNLWAYIDARDAAQAMRLALDADISGAEVFVIANADSVMARPNAELLAEVFPGVAEKRPFAPNETLLAIDKAKRMLGYAPQFSWRDNA